MIRLFRTVPTVWEVKFPNYDLAHRIYHQVAAILNTKLGHSLVNNNCWYINTTLEDDEFQKQFVICMKVITTGTIHYTLSKTQVGTYGPWIPGPWQGTE